MISKPLIREVNGRTQARVGDGGEVEVEFEVMRIKSQNS